MLPHLSRLCRNYLLSNLRPSNVLSIFEFAEGIQETELLEPCMDVSKTLQLFHSPKLTQFMQMIYGNFIQFQDRSHILNLVAFRNQ